MKDAQLSEGEVRAALDRLISQPEFGASERRAAFLRFVVEETLAGRAYRLKGFTIANAVFGRDETFDPKTDPIVRLEARRLRQDLDSYYVGPGAADPIRISIPKGGYTPVFEDHYDLPRAPSPEVSVPRPALVASPFGWTGPGQTAPDLRSRAPRLWPRTVGAVGAILALVGMLALVGILAVAWLSRGDTLPADSLAARGYPRVVIMPFVAVDSSEGSRALSASLGAELIHDLRHFEGFRIYQPPDGSDRVSVAAKLRGEPGALYAVYGQIQVEGAWARINASLHDLRTEEVIWNAAYDVAIAPGALVDLRDAVAGRIATALGQPYGPISEDLGRRNSSAQPASLDSYRCVLASYDYRRNFSSTAYGPMLACLEAAVARDPEYSDAWAMLGWLHLDAGRYEFPGAAPMEAEYNAALAAARHAQALAPESVLALKALSSIQHYRGRYDESERLARRAVELNPHDPDSLAQLGWRLAVRGKFDEGVPLLRQAIDRTVDPPGWYFHLIAIDHLMKGDYAAMRREAERAALSGRPIAEALLAIAAGGLGDRETARAALNRIDPASLIGRDAATYFRRHGATEEIVTALMDGLDRARRLAADPPPR